MRRARCALVRRAALFAALCAAWCGSECAAAATVQRSQWRRDDPQKALAFRASDNPAGVRDRAVRQSGTTTRFAYTSIFYTGTPRDNEYLQGMRVMFETVRRSKTEFDLVAIVAEDVPAHIEKRLLKDGLIVTRAKTMTNPYESRGGDQRYNARFVKVFNKLHAWTLTQYERVLMLDSDLLFLQNADELFLCGKFCAVYVNPCLFHTGLLALAPSNATLQRMIAEFDQMDSYDGGDQGFLNSFYAGLLNAPIFKPPVTAAQQKQQLAGPLDDNDAARELARLPFGYHLDHFYYYQRMQWEVPCSETKIVGFPGIAMLKPWYWWTWPFLPLAIEWHAVCFTLDACGPSRAHVFVLVAVPVIALTALLAVVARKSSPSSQPATATAASSLPPPAARWSSALVNLISSVISSYPAGLIRQAVSLRPRMVLSWLLCAALPMKVLPRVMHPLAAWPIYFLYAVALLAWLVFLAELPAALTLGTLAVFALGIFAQTLRMWNTAVLKLVCLVLQFSALAAVAAAALVVAPAYSSAEKREHALPQSPQPPTREHRGQSYSRAFTIDDST